MREMLARLARHACVAADLDRACVFLRDQLSEVSMTVAAVHGLPQELVGQSFGIVDGTAGRVLLSGSPALVDGGAASAGPREHALGWTRGMVSVPVRWAGQVRAALAVGSSDPDRVIDERDLEVVSEIAELGASAIEHAERRQELEAAVEASMSTLARAVAMRDPRSGQSDRIVDLAEGIGRELGLSEDELAELRLAALLRDVGKIAVPDAVLRKPGPLSGREWDVMRRHPEWGGEMVFGIPGLEGVAAIVVHHHEHYDGNGYPDRLAGPDISLRSRIVAACDAYDAMVSDRPYRSALRPITALRELERRSGTQFDPEVVTALKKAARVSRE
ncbi:MAG: HD-GYP domain-containing protein [Thermoleophilaceae bacterium]